MKTEIIQKDFPKYMKSKTSELVVLFTNESTGMVTTPDVGHALGCLMCNWDATRFEDIESKVDKPFPKLMIHIDGDLVVLFTADAKGTVMTNVGDWGIGTHYANWATEHFKDFNGSIKLSNGE